MAVDLIYYASYGQNRRVRNCLKDGVHVDALNFREESSLLFAAQNGRISTVNMLLKHGAEPNRLSSEGLSPVLAAAFNGHDQCVKTLIEKSGIWGLQKLKTNNKVKFSKETEEIIDVFKVQTSEIQLANTSRSIDVYHIFSLKDCVIRNEKCTAKIQLRHSFHHHNWTEEEDNQWLQKELEILRSLRHPHILQPYFISISKEKKYNILLSEPIKEGNLYHVMYDLKQRINAEKCKKIIQETLYAFVYLSSKKIIHNFINSTSVFILRDWKVKIGNMEYSHHEGEPMRTRFSAAAEEFHLPYRAPELIRETDSLPNRSADVYSYGCLAWELLGRKRPWCWIERNDVISLAQINHPVSLPVPDCWPLFLRSIIISATHLEAHKRPTFQQLYEDIFKTSIQTDVSPPLKSRVSVNNKRRRNSNGSQVRFSEILTSTQHINDKKTGKHIPISISVTRKGCLKMTSHSTAVIKKVLPSNIQAHTHTSRCMCNKHVNVTNSIQDSSAKQCQKQSKLVISHSDQTADFQERSSPLVEVLSNQSSKSKEKVEKSLSNRLQGQSKSLMKVFSSNQNRSSKKETKSTLAWDSKFRSHPLIILPSTGISKERIVRVHTADSDIGETESNPTLSRIQQLAKKHQRSEWSHVTGSVKEHDDSLIMDKESRRNTIQKHSFIKDFLRVYDSLPSSMNHKFGPRDMENADYYDEYELEKEALIRQIFETAGKCEKKVWAKATMHDRDLLGRRCYKSKSWCNFNPPDQRE